MKIIANHAAFILVFLVGIVVMPAFADTSEVLGSALVTGGGTVVNGGLSLSPETEALGVEDSESEDEVSAAGVSESSLDLDAAFVGPVEPPATRGSPFSGSSVIPSREVLDRETTLQRRVESEGVEAAIPWYRHGMVALLLVLFAISVTGWIARRLLRPAMGSGSDLMEVIRRTHLSPKQSIALVRLGDRFAFVGVTSDRISMLHCVTDLEETLSLQEKIHRRQSSAERAAFKKALEEESASFEVGDDACSPSDDLVSDRSARLSETRNELKSLLTRLQGHCGGDMKRVSPDGTLPGAEVPD